MIVEKHNTPEQNVCDEMGIKMLWSIGGDEKVAASSELVKNVVNVLGPNRRLSGKSKK